MILDILALILFAATVVTPFVTISLVWKKSKKSRALKILIGILLSLGIAFVFFITALLIVFRNGIGWR